ITLAGSGTYDLIAFNSIGRATSSVARVTVLQAPLVEEPLTSRIVDAGTTVILRVTASGNPGLTYAWQFNGMALSSATNYFLVVSNVLPADSGYYRVN